MPVIRRNLICPESITIHVKNILATLTVRDVWSAAIAACISSMMVIGTRTRTRTLTCARVQYCLVERWPACNSRTRHEPGRGRRSHGASASARCDVNTSAVTRQCFSGFPVNRPLACLRPNGTEHRTGTGADAVQSGCANTDTKRRVQHCVGLSFFELPQRTLYRLYLFAVTRYCFVLVQKRTNRITSTIRRSRG